MTEIIPTEKTLDSLKTLVSDILKEAKKLGATSAEVDLGLSKGFSVAVRNQDVESVEYNQDKDIGISVFVGKKTGSASLSDVRPEAIRAAVEAAINIARFTDEDPYAGLAEKELLAFNYPEIETFFPWDVTVDEAIQLAKNCEERALSKDKRISMAESVGVATGQGVHVYGNSEGFIGTSSSTRHELSCVLIAKHKDEMQRDYSYTVATDPSMLKSGDAVADEAVERAVRRLNARRLSTRRAPVIFYSSEARGLLGHFVAAITGGNLYRKSSFLLDRIDTRIFPDHIRIDERPHLPKELGSSPFDDNGVGTRPNVFVENGTLLSYVLGVYSARKLGLKTTGNAGGVHNLFISTGENDLKGLIKKMHTGLLVTEMMGNGVNLITGDYSRGVSGFWIENGEIQYPVEEITIASNLNEMYKGLVEVGNDVDHRGNIHTGSILLSEMMIAGE